MHAEKPIEKLLLECKNLFENANLTEAKKIADKILFIQPDNLSGLEITFFIQLKTETFELAKTSLLKIAEQTGKTKKWNLLEINYFEAKQDYFHVLKLIQEYFKLYGEDFNLLYTYGLNALKAGKIIAAQDALQTCTKGNFSSKFLLLNLGHIYKAKGQSTLAADCYQKFILASPEECGVGYWSLADLKDFTFDDNDKSKINAFLDQPNITTGNIALLNFALARVQEQQENFVSAYQFMCKANNIIAHHRPFKADLFANLIKGLISGVDKVNFNSSVKQSSAFKPIFIVGMPRSGTTLVEQILASHTLVQPTDELPFIERIALELEKSGGYISGLKSMSELKKKSFTVSYEKQIQQYFSEFQTVTIDKNPNNYLHIALIKKLYPNAKIINCIRNPIDNAMSVFKQYFSNGHDYSYSMKGIAFYWQGYLTLMHHWKKVFGDEIYHLSYESLTINSEEEIRKLLNYCELDFEPDCLTFYKSDRIVLTPSVSQVRQPINTRSVNSWMNYKDSINEHLPVFEKILAKSKELLN